MGMCTMAACKGEQAEKKGGVCTHILHSQFNGALREETMGSTAHEKSWGRGSPMQVGEESQRITSFPLGQHFCPGSKQPSLLCRSHMSSDTPAQTDSLVYTNPAPKRTVPFPSC